MSKIVQISAVSSGTLDDGIGVETLIDIYGLSSLGKLYHWGKKEGKVGWLLMEDKLNK